MESLGAIGAMLLVVAILTVVAAGAISRTDSNSGSFGAAPLVAMVGLTICATLLGVMGLAFVMASNSDTFGR